MRIPCPEVWLAEGASQHRSSWAAKCTGKIRVWHMHTAVFFIEGEKDAGIGKCQWACIHMDARALTPCILKALGTRTLM